MLPNDVPADDLHETRNFKDFTGLYPLAQSVYSTRHPPEFKVSPALRAAAGGELLPHRSHLVRLATLVAACLLFPAALWAQRDSSARTPPSAAPRLGLLLPPELQPFGILAAERPDAERVARTWAQQLDQRLSLATRRALFGAPIAPADATGVLRGGVIPNVAAPTNVPTPAVSVAPGASSPVADTTRNALSGLDVDLQTRIEARGERFVDHRCVPGAANAQVAGCRTALSPNLNVQFALKSAGSVAERFHVNVDFDSQREFDASNHLQVWYEGKPGSRIRRVELGNVAFNAPSSRFLGAAVPAGNYGLQAEAMLGPVKLQAIAAQQKGNIVRERQFSIGERTLQSGDREIEDWQIEPRRFFFSIDPRQIPGYPAIDILDRAQLTAARAALPEAMRPTRLQVYRLQFGATPQNPNGPRLRVQEEGERTELEPQTYDVLREGVDYYADPSLLWFALVRPLNQANERLLVAYNVRIDGRDTISVTTGGTPDVERRSDREQIANLVWDPNVTPLSRSFAREIRSVYRIGGADLVRERTQLRVVAGAGNQEKPLAGDSETYLQMFGLSQPTNSAEFDVEQRLWPRRGDPVFNLGAGAGVDGSEAPRILTDHFLVMPSLQPFAATSAGGLVEQGNPSNEAIYSTPGEYLAFGSPRHPASIYRLVLRYDVEGSPERGSLMLGGVALRRASERISVDGVALVRDIDYRIDYELGRVTFLRPDTLFDRPRTVAARFEENPIFAATPTRLAGLTSQWSFPRGQLALTAVSQSQASAFTRPQLGFERAAATMAGITGNYSLPLAPLTRALSRLPWGATTAPSRLDIQGELALSRPQSLERAQAYLESFEGEGGVQIGLLETSWQLSSMPAYGRGEVRSRYLGQLERERAAPFVWQSFATQNGRALTFGLTDIDPQVQLAGFSSLTETLLWLTLHSHRCGALDEEGRCSWPQADGPRGTRWRSIRTSLGAGGRDLSLAEQIEFWTLVDTSALGRRRNPTLVLDVGEISENTLAFAPETLYVRPGSETTPDSLFAGKVLAGFDSLNTERDVFTRAFDAAKNDIGLPGDKADSIVVSNGSGGVPLLRRERDVPICRGAERRARALGDLRASCTVRNGRLDEEDIDLDGTLNFKDETRESERLLRYVIDLSDTTTYVRVGKRAILVDTVDGRPMEVEKHWVLVRVPFGAPDERIGEPQLRRMRGLRLTMISGQELGDRDPSSIAIARMRFVAAPWVKRGDGPVNGVAGENRQGAGFTIVSLIGTADRDSARGLIYEPPPGVTDQPETIGGELQGATQINERSLRILAGGLESFQRAEAFHRFSAGQQNFMGYRELRLWARGHGDGWLPNGEMQFFVRIGRDEHNFYLYRTPVNSGTTQGAWLPEIRVDFRKLQSLRERMERSQLGQDVDSIACTGVDSALIAASALPLGGAPRRRAVCEDGYMVYSVEPGVTPPNLAAVQELAVGMFRLPSTGTTPVLPGDTLELWVDDIRLARAVDDVGTAGHLSVDLVAADVAALRLAYTRRGANFRQLGESPTFIDEGALDVTTTVRLEKLLPRGMQLTIPLTVTHTQVSDDPLFLSRTDVRARGVEGLRTPKTGVTTWHLAARRATPISHPWLGPILNNLVLSSTYVAGGTRSEYQDGRTRHLTFGVDYVVAGAPRAVRLFGDNSFRWNPTQLRITSALASGNDARDHFFKPAPAFDDIARRTEADTRVWRTGTTLEFRPTDALTARWDLFSLRDLRNYDSLDPASRLADAAGGQLGFERERTMQIVLEIAPKVREWFRPRFDVTTAYGMLRDPNARAFVMPVALSRTDSIHQDALVTTDSRSASHTQLTDELPRRLTASQSATAGLQFDLARAVGARDSSVGPVKRFVRGLTPIDLSYNRSLLSAFDAANFAPPLGFQLALRGADGFRQVRGTPATAAGITETMTAQTSLALPFGTTIANRFRRIENTSWTTRIDATQIAVDGVQTFFPDATLRWSWRPGTNVTSPLVTGASTSIGYTASAARVTLPGLGLLSGDLAEPASFRTTRVRTLPINASVTWGLGQLSTAAGLTRTERTDSLPGSIARGSSTELTADAGRAFRVPQSWGLGLRNEVRARLTWQESRTRTVVDDVSGRTQGRLADNGRRVITLNADTDVSETLLFTLQGSRVLNTDRNLDRRISQLVLSAVMQIQFYGGRAGAGGGEGGGTPR